MMNGSKKFFKYICNKLNMPRVRDIKLKSFIMFLLLFPVILGCSNIGGPSDNVIIEYWALQGEKVQVLNKERCPLTEVDKEHGIKTKWRVVVELLDQIGFEGGAAINVDVWLMRKGEWVLASTLEIEEADYTC